jgi:hypothetical protein
MSKKLVQNSFVAFDPLDIQNPSFEVIWKMHLLENGLIDRVVITMDAINVIEGHRINYEK